MRIAIGLRLGVLLVVVAVTGLFASTASGQGTPFGGTMTITLVPSTLAPPVGTNFTMDLSIDATLSTATCSGIVPFVVGGYTIEMDYDKTKVQFISRAACPTAPTEYLAAPTCASDISGNPGKLTCSSDNGASETAPTGNVCVARLTFKNTAASVGSPAVLTTVSSGGTFGVSSALVFACPTLGTFPGGSITEGSTGNITPVALKGFSAD